MNGKLQAAAVALLLVIFVAAFFGPVSVANAGGDAQRNGQYGLTADTIDELVARLATGAELTIPARGERYAGTEEIRSYLRGALPQGREVTLLRANRTAGGFQAVVAVSDRGVRWAQMTVDATVAGTELTRLEVAGIRLMLWQG